MIQTQLFHFSHTLTQEALLRNPGKSFTEKPRKSFTEKLPKKETKDTAKTKKNKSISEKAVGLVLLTSN